VVWSRPPKLRNWNMGRGKSKVPQLLLMEISRAMKKEM